MNIFTSLLTPIKIIKPPPLTTITGRHGHNTRMKTYGTNDQYDRLAEGQMSR